MCYDNVDCIMYKQCICDYIMRINLLQVSVTFESVMN